MSGFYAWLRAIPAVQNRVEADVEAEQRLDPLLLGPDESEREIARARVSYEDVVNQRAATLSATRSVKFSTDETAVVASANHAVQSDYAANIELAELEMPEIAKESLGLEVELSEVKGIGEEQVQTCVALSQLRGGSEVLDLARASDAVRVFIGSENPLFSLSGSSLIVAPYMNAERRVVGALGVIGPTRLNYARVIPLVDYTARVLGQVMNT